MARSPVSSQLTAWPNRSSGTLSGSISRCLTRPWNRLSTTIVTVRAGTPGTSPRRCRIAAATSRSSTSICSRICPAIAAMNSGLRTACSQNSACSATNSAFLSATRTSSRDNSPSGSSPPGRAPAGLASRISATEPIRSLTRVVSSSRNSRSLLPKLEYTAPTV